MSERVRRNLEEQRIRRALARLPEDASLETLAFATQAALEYVTDKAIALIAERTGSPPEAVRTGVAAADTLRTAPLGTHRVTICTGKTCARRGGAELVKAARARLEAEVFASSPDGAVYLEPFRCFGQCAMAPNIRIDGALRGAMTPERFGLLLEMLRRRAGAT